MNILKKVLFIIAGIVALFLIIALFLPARMAVERTVFINKPIHEVYAKVADFNHWPKWNPWTEMEPKSKNTITGEAGKAGSVWSWEGNQIGKGSMVLDSVSENKALKTTLNFAAPMEAKASSDWKFEISGTGANVSWVFDGGEAPYPHGRFIAMMMDMKLGGQFEKGLQNLKKLCEGK